MNWHFYIDSPQQRALDLCRGSFDEGKGWGDGDGYGDSWGDGLGAGTSDELTAGYSEGPLGGRGYSYCWGNGNGESENEW
jgi:hypothetical protein